MKLMPPPEMPPMPPPARGHHLYSCGVVLVLATALLCSLLIVMAGTFITFYAIVKSLLWLAWRTT